MKKTCFDVRKLSVKDFLNDSTETDSLSFIHKKYISGCPNNSPESTANGMLLSFCRLMPQYNEDALFGVHIKETIRQFRALFVNRKIK